MVYYARRQQNIQQSRQKHTIKHKEEHNIQKDKKYTKHHTLSLIHSLFGQKHQIPTELHLERKKLKIKRNTAVTMMKVVGQLYVMK